MALSNFDYLSGALGVFSLVIAFYVGLKIISKYFKHKKKEFWMVGLVAIFATEPWWPLVISFLLVLGNSEPLPPKIYFLIGNVCVPIGIFLWLWALTILMWEKKKKIILTFGLVYVIVFEVILFSLLFFIDYNLIGEQIGLIDAQYHPVMLVLLISGLAIILSTGLIFARESLRSENPEIRLKGKFLIVAFMSFCAGASIEALFPLTLVGLIMAKSLLLTAVIGFYGGFISPDWLKRIFLKK